MTEAGDFIKEVWNEVNVILQDLADDETAREIVRAVYRKVEPTPVHTDEERNEQLVALLETARDLCVTHLLRLARQDLATGRRESRAVCLLLRFFEPQMQAAVHRLIRCVHDAEAVTNDVRRRIWSGLQDFEGGRRQLHYYVKKACQSACVDLGRRTTRDEQLQGLNGMVEPWQDDCQQHAIVEFKAFLRDSLPLLPTKKRQAVEAFLRFDGDWAAAEEALGIPRQTLASRFQSAAGRLCKLWGPR